MPRPGTTPPVRASADAEHGSSAELARLQLPAQQSDASLGGAEPSKGDIGPEALGLPPEADPNADINGGYDEALFQPSGRPNEPVFAGVAFGGGPNYRQSDSEDDRTFMLRVADDLERTGSPQTKRFIEKIRAGG